MEQRLKDQENFKQMQWHQIVTDGGVGDLICELVAVDFNVKNFPDILFNVWVPEYLKDFAIHVLNTKKCKVFSFSEAKEKFRHDILGTTTEWCTNHTPMRTHPVDYGFHMLSDRHVYDLNKKNYLKLRSHEISLQDFNLPEKYIVLVCTAAEPVKELPIKTANELIDFIISKGYEVVFLGKEKSEIGYKEFCVKAKPIPLNYNKGINLLNKTNLLQAGAIISKAKVIVGMDSGLIHLAGCTDTEIIAGYTLVDPVHVAPIRNGSQKYKFQAIEPEILIKNRYFQTNTSFLKGDYRKFPNWEKVVDSMTSEKFIKALNNIL